MTLVLAILGRYWQQIAIVAVALIAWGYADQLWCNGPCRRARAAIREYETRMVAAQKRATDLALLYAKTLDNIDRAVKQQKETDRATFDVLASRARELPARASVRLSDSAVRLWSNATGAANDPRPAGVGTQPAAAVPGSAQGQAIAGGGGGGGDLWYSEQDVVSFVVESALAYRDARARWAACVQSYDAIRVNPPQE